MLRHAAAAALFALLAIVMTWPLAANLDRAAADPEDPFLNTFILHWNYVATFSSPGSLFHAPIFHPAKYALAFSENLYGIALLLFPLQAAGLPPLTVYNIAIIAGFALSGLAAYLLALELTGSAAGSVVAGIFFAFLPYRFVQLTHLQHVWSVWLPLLLLALIRFRRSTTWRNAAFFGIAFLFNGLSNVHWLVLGSTATALSALFLFATSRDRRSWLRLLAAATVGGVLLLPFLVPYARAASLYGMERLPGDVKVHSASLGDWVMVGGRSRMYESFRGTWRENHELNLGFGLVALLLSGAAIFLTRRREGLSLPVPSPSGRRALLALNSILVLSAALAYLAASASVLDMGILRMRDASVPSMIFAIALVARLWLTGAISSFLARSRFTVDQWSVLLWIPVGVLGSFGMHTFFHQFLYARIAPFRSIRVPARWSMIAYVGIAVLVALGVAALIDRIPRRRWKTAAASGLAALLLAELFTPPIRWYVAHAEPPAVYRWLRDASVSGAVFEVPLTLGSDEYGYLLRQTHHRKRLINGVSGFSPKTYDEVAWLTGRSPIPDRLVDRLQDFGCSTIVIHADRLFDRSADVRNWLRIELRRGRLLFLRRFDHGLEGDYVFAVARREPNVLALREPADETALTAFLEGSRRTYNREPFGTVIEPKGGTWVEGPLAVSGWALAPHGIREVNLLFGNGRIRVPARLEQWRELTRDLYPQYLRVEQPAFRATFERPLPGLRRDTDLQVEIVDGRGTRVLLDPVWFSWTEEIPSKRWKPRTPSIHPSAWRQRELDTLLLSLGADVSAETPRILDGRTAITELAYAWAESLEQQSDAVFIDRAYETLLKRPSEKAGREFYLRQLNQGAHRSDVINAMIGSAEFAHAHGLAL